MNWLGKDPKVVPIAEQRQPDKPPLSLEKQDSPESSLTRLNPGLPPSPVKNQDEITVVMLVKRMIAEDASDIHINAGSSPIFRIDGKLLSLGYPVLGPQKCKELARSILSDKQFQQFEEVGEIDFSFGLEGLGRVRANAYVQRGSVGMALRNIPWKIPTFDDLGLPKAIQVLCEKPRGLVLITGPTGHGKSTTLAAMIDYINKKYERHIITIEDPIEYLHRNNKSVITQREVHIDPQSFHNALRTILRQDPDVVLIGEMRDLETIKSALTIAETGHLTFATLHTNSAVETINRIVDAFDPDKQTQIRAQLSFVLEGVVSQQLMPKASKSGRSLAVEIMLPNTAIRNLIREGKIHQIYSIMQTSQSQTIMQTMNLALVRLYKQGEISYQEMMYRTSDRAEILQIIEKVGGKMPEADVRKK